MVCPINSRKRKGVRALVGQRDGWQCRYCRRPLSEDAANPHDRPTLDHTVPRSKGGRNLLRNLVLACRTCNNHKGNTDLADWLATQLPQRTDSAVGHAGAPDPDRAVPYRLSSRSPTAAG